jgi:hypothetical protein
MRRQFSLLVLSALVLFAGACRDTSSPTAARALATASTTETCTTDLNTVLGLAADAFGAGSPNFNSVRGKIENLQLQLTNNNKAAANDRAHDIVNFTLSKNAETPLPGGEDAVAAFANSVYCFAGIDITVEDPSNSKLIFPLDLPQIIYNDDFTSAVSFGGDPVFEPSLVTITKNTSSQLGGLTKLDRFPGYITITFQNASGTTLKIPATVSVCAFDVPDDVFDDLRLGHGKNNATVFEITPAPSGDDPIAAPLECESPTPELAFAERLVRAVSSFLSPSSLHASATAVAVRGGGISGTVSEFSPFEPVDTKLRSAGGGISGTVSEFLRASPMMDLRADAGIQSLLNTPDCSAIPVGTAFPSECLPTVTVRTRTNNTPFANVPVEWSIPATSGGTIAIANGNLSSYSCGTYARSQSDLTNAEGASAVCWQVDTVGAYRVTARPMIGGDAIEGVTFDDGNGADSVSFTLTVQPVTISIASANPVTAAAGSVIAPRVRVLQNGAPVAGVTVDWTALANSDAMVSPGSTVTDGEGYAWTNWTIGAGYNELRAKVRNAADSIAVTFTATGSSGTIVMNSCPVGGSRDPINDPSKPYAFWVPGPSNGQTMREVDLYFGASGKANKPTDYRIALITRRGAGFLSLFADTTINIVELRGNSSENKLATFRLRTPLVGASGNPATSATAVAMQLVVLTNPDGATVNFNTGPCPLGGCKVPKGCDATEVNLNSVTAGSPLGTTYRRSVGVTIRGN